MKQLAAAILAVMDEVKGIEKSLTVGTGSNSYKGVSDKDVKHTIGAAMVKNGLCIIPTGVTSKTQIDRWESDYQGNKQMKQSVHVECETKYLLLHTSGESIELAGYGHGVDSQDKAAGKATTYALKYALLYVFMVPTGTIDDADKTHSDEVPVPAKRTTPVPVQYSPEIFKEIQACKTAADIVKLWDKYPALWENAEFKAKMGEQRAAVNQKA